MDDPLSIDWDITSFATKEIPQGYCAPHPDCIVISHSGIEVGTIEIKPLYTCKELVEVDLCRIGELCKRQLHLRMKVAKTTKELDNNGEYKLIQHGTLEISNFACDAQQMETFLEMIISFKIKIMESLAEPEEDKPCIYDQHSHMIKPTIAFDNLWEYF
ncbi:hypothetical protein [Parasitella parasitica]|uniref:Uncharacterized protein n=1 Tax=Parasitella parasitica TaxID=35722 RepID=A0A0B7NWF3_9FUNG|nr:hypothetical protein [Parasitella parasitica]